MDSDSNSSGPPPFDWQEQFDWVEEPTSGPPIFTLISTENLAYDNWIIEQLFLRGAFNPPGIAS